MNGSMNGSLEACTKQSGGCFDQVPCEAWREATLDDSRMLTMVVDAEGAIVDATESTRQSLGIDAETGTLRLWTLLPEPVAREHAQYMREAIQRNKPIRVVGMLWGTMRQTLYRPIKLDTGAAAVFVCSRLAGSEEISWLSRVHEPFVRAANDDMRGFSQLTARELEVFALIGEGLSTTEIAQRLFRSEKTVEWHRASLGQKLGASNRVQLARLAIVTGLTAFANADEERRIQVSGPSVAELAPVLA